LYLGPRSCSIIALTPHEDKINLPAEPFVPPCRIKEIFSAKGAEAYIVDLSHALFLKHLDVRLFQVEE
jgi:hypothetical protein